MSRSAWLWIIALVVTLASARWQQKTGPTYELSGTFMLGDDPIHYVLERTHAGPGDHVVRILKAPADVEGLVEWRPHRAPGTWTSLVMQRSGDSLSAALPHQPPAGKLWYRVKLSRGRDVATIPGDRPAAIRFRGHVPPWLLVPHIGLMFLAMLLSTRAGFEVFCPKPALKGLTWWTLAVLFAGGMALGPFVTHYAFGPWWTGFPVGNDLTDSKTLVAFVCWIAAAIAVHRLKLARAWVFLAALVTLLIFAIPHSWSGGEPTYGELEAMGSAAPAAPDKAVVR